MAFSSTCMSRKFLVLTSMLFAQSSGFTFDKILKTVILKFVVPFPQGIIYNCKEEPAHLIVLGKGFNNHLVFLRGIWITTEYSYILK